MTETAPRTLSMRTRDGVRLDADVYFPDAARHGTGPYPVLLQRAFGGRRLASSRLYAHPRWYADQGYIVAVQDARGAGTSEGALRPLALGVEDGADAVHWAAGLPQSAGRVGLFGHDHQGLAQLYAALGVARSPRAGELRAMAPCMAPFDLHGDWAYEGGAFVRGAEARAIGEDAPAAADGEAPSSGSVHPWREHAAPDAHYWAERSPSSLGAEGTDVPALFVGGWADRALPGAIGGFAAARGPRALLIGPWSATTWGRRAGAYDHGPAAVSVVDAVQLRWFDRWLKERGNAADPPLLLFELFGGRWRAFPDWPETRPSLLFLQSDGLAGARSDHGRLSSVPPARDGADVIVHDPADPAPAIGGHWAAPFGPQDRAEADERGDVACYTGDPFTADAALAGEVTAELFVEADAPGFDLAATLSLVAPDGRASVLTQGYRRVASGETPVRLGLRHVCARLPVGHRLRLSLAGAASPAFEPPAEGDAGRRGDGAARPVTLAIRGGRETPSRVILPEIDP